MRAAWHSLYKPLVEATGPVQARRVANLALAVSSHPATRSCASDPRALADRARELAEGLSAAIPAKVDWHELSRLLGEVRRPEADSSWFDDWVEAFQASDGGRKSLGAYATPAPFAEVLARFSLGEIDPQRAPRVVDPAAGTGNLLVAAYYKLVEQGCSREAALDGLHGAELDPAAREFCVLRLWLAAEAPLASVRGIAENIVLDNALTRDWWGGREAFDVVIMNPPWESLRHGREDAGGAEVRRRTLARLVCPSTGAPDLPLLYTAHGRGDRNLFKAFMELALHLLADGGRLGALVPAAFGSDDGMADLRRLYTDELALERWTTFENRARYFQIDGRYKFGLLSGKRSRAGTEAIWVRGFGAHPTDVSAPHIRIDRADLEQIGGRDQMLPELTSEAERDVLVKMLGSGRPLFDGGPLNRVRYRREVDLTLGRKDGRFRHVFEGSTWAAPNDDLLSAAEVETWVPVLEGRMVGAYDCFQKSYVTGSGRSARWEANGDRLIERCQPQFVSHPRRPQDGRVAICDVTSATNTRTVVATLVPHTWLCGNTAPVLQFESSALAEAAVAILNSMVFDWMTRRIVSGLHLNKFYLSHLRWPDLSLAAVKDLTDLGRTLSASAVRGGLDNKMPMPFHSGEDRVSALAQVEVLVAMGFGISRAEMQFMFHPTHNDRRGFWRFFEADSQARRISELAISQLEKGPKELAA